MERLEEKDIQMYYKFVLIRSIDWISIMYIFHVSFL